METVSGVNNWRLIIRREADGAAILRASTCDVRAALPETLLGLPVTALGDHALSPSAGGVPGERLTVTCGPVPEDADWNNRRLEELTLPPSLRRVGDYALFNCSGLKTLCLHDNIRHWGGGVLMNCRLLDTLRIVRKEEGESLAYFAGELSRELDVTVTWPGGERVRLLFPEYAELYEENCPAHHFDYNIQGAGYPYHHCFRNKRLDLREYDKLWPGFLAMEHDPEAALRLALRRLRYPRELTERARKDYLAYLQGHAGEALRAVLAERDGPGLRFLLDSLAPDRETLTAALAQAREGNDTGAVAVLLEERRRRFPSGTEKTFDL